MPMRSGEEGQGWQARWEGRWKRRRPGCRGAEEDRAREATAARLDVPKRGEAEAGAAAAVAFADQAA